MALRMKVEIGNTGLKCDHLKVVGFVFGKFETEEKKLVDVFRIKLGIFLSKEAEEKGLDPVATQDIDAKIEELNGKGSVMKQIYSHLMGREEFKEAKYYATKK